jgi:hypothetical protein
MGFLQEQILATIPTYIKTMPPLFVDMSGASPDFTINFNSYNDNQFEYVKFGCR